MHKIKQYNVRVHSHGIYFDAFINNLITYNKSRNLQVLHQSQFLFELFYTQYNSLNYCLIFSFLKLFGFLPSGIQVIFYAVAFMTMTDFYMTYVHNSFIFINVVPLDGRTVSLYYREVL